MQQSSTLVNIYAKKQFHKYKQTTKAAKAFLYRQTLQQDIGTSQSRLRFGSSYIYLMLHVETEFKHLI
jgi:hypothetical protein